MLCGVNGSVGVRCPRESEGLSTRNGRRRFLAQLKEATLLLPTWATRFRGKVFCATEQTLRLLSRALSRGVGPYTLHTAYGGRARDVYVAVAGIAGALSWAGP